MAKPSGKKVTRKRLLLAAASIRKLDTNYGLTRPEGASDKKMVGSAASRLIRRRGTTAQRISIAFEKSGVELIDNNGPFGRHGEGALATCRAVSRPARAGAAPARATSSSSAMRRSTSRIATPENGPRWA